MVKPIAEMAPHLRYWPDQGAGPKFYIPGHLYKDMLPYLAAVRRKYPNIPDDIPGMTPLGLDPGYYFGPHEDVEIDREISEKFDIPPSPGSPDGGEVDEPRLKRRDREPEPEVPVNYGRGRPAKYDFKSLKKIGDSFMVLEGKLAHTQSAARKYLLRYKLELDHKIECIRTKPGILVVMTACADDSVADHVDQTYDN